VETCFEHAVELDQLGARDSGLKGLDRLDRADAPPVMTMRSEPKSRVAGSVEFSIAPIDEGAVGMYVMRALAMSSSAASA